MEYKKIYLPEEITEMTTWFKTNWNRLPTSLQMDKATYIPDLKLTISNYLAICEEHATNPTYGGQIRLIFLIKEKLIDENLLQPEKE